MTRFVASLVLWLAANNTLAQTSDIPADPPVLGAHIVTIGGNATEITFALGAGSRVVATDITSVYPAAAKSLPSVGYMRTISAEGVLSSKADGVIAAGDAGPAASLGQIRMAGVPVVLLPNEHSYESLITSVDVIARALDLAPQGVALCQSISTDWSKTKQYVRGFKTAPRVMFLLSYAAANGVMVAGQNTSADAMIRLAGGVNATSGFRGYKPLSTEDAIVAAPDVILVTDEGIESAGGVDHVLNQPGIALTPAASKRRVISMESLYLLGFGPRLPAAVAELSKRIHEDQ